MKLLASDFDKTFFTEDYLKNIKKVNEFVDKGNIFIIITGRNITKLEEYIKGYNIKYNYLICNNGGIIFDNQNKVIYRKDIDPLLVKPILDILNNDSNISYTVIDNSKEYVADPNELANIILARPYDMAKADDLLKYIMDKFPDVHGYSSAHWINITNKEVSKGKTLKYIQNLLNIPTENIYTIGDNNNDISMNKIYNGYAMENSIDELIKVSRDKVKSVSNLIDIIYNND